MDFLLASGRMLDCCYRVNSELMRKGASMMRRYNNSYLVEAILDHPIPEYIEEQDDEPAWLVSSEIAKLITSTEQAVDVYTC